MALEPGALGLAHGGQALGRARRARRVLQAAGDLRDQGRETELGVADQAGLDPVVGADDHGIDVDVDDRDVPAGDLAVFGGGRARAAADEDHGVGAGHDLAGLVRPAVGADHADRQGMVVGDRAVAADGGRDRGVQEFGQGRELGGGSRDDRPAAADEDRPPSGQDRLGRRGDEVRRRPRPERREDAVLGLGPEVEIEGLLLEVVGQADVGRAGAAGGRGPERRPEDVRHLRDVVDDRVPLGQGTEQGLLVELGQRIAAARGDGDVGGDRDQGDR